MPAALLQARIQLVYAERTVLLGWNYRDLRAPYWRIYAHPAAGAQVRVTGSTRWINLDPGRIWLIAPQTSFATRAPDGLEHFYVHMRLGLPYDAALPAIDSRPISAEEYALMAAVPRHDQQLDPALALSLQALAATVASGLAAARWPQSGRDPLLELLLRRMHDQPERCPDNTSLARELGLGADAFHRRFVAATGCAPQTWLRQRRLDLAAIRLECSDDGIDSIAVATGFCDRHHFSRAFARRYGQGPAAYRRQLRR